MSRSKKNSLGDDEMDITPMIDCVFLLLIFFMVTSTMQPEGALKPPAAKNGQSVNTVDAVTIEVTAERHVSVLDEHGETLAEFDLNEDPEQNEEIVKQVTTYVEQQKKLTIILKSDRDVPSGLVEQLAKAANEAELQDDQELKFFIAVMDKG